LLKAQTGTIEFIYVAKPTPHTVAGPDFILTKGVDVVSGERG